MNFNIELIQPPNYPHTRAFDEIIGSLEQALRCKTSINGFQQGKKLKKFDYNIIIGAHTLVPDMIKMLPSNSIIYNSEQLSPNNPLTGKHYMDLLANSLVLDYSNNNILSLASYKSSFGGNGTVAWLPYGLSKKYFGCIPKASKDTIDVLFYGAVNERRSAIIESLRDEGVDVKCLFGVYGKQRDAIISRSTIILNLNKDDSRILETPRVNYLLANNKIVVTEMYSDTDCPNFISDSLKPEQCGSYTQLVSKIKHLLSDDQAELRESIELNASTGISSYNYKQAVITAVSELIKL
jgi:hypothetical protein